VPGRRRESVEVEDCDQRPQQGRGPIIKRLNVYPVEDFSPEKVDVRGLVLVGQRRQLSLIYEFVAKARSGVAPCTANLSYSNVPAGPILT
jgi:hypothetical protein